MLILLLIFLVHLTGVYPIWLAVRACRHSTILHAVCWMFAAWLSWGALLIPIVIFQSAAYVELQRIVSLSLTGCCGIAVMGARRPIVTAWNLVVFGLLAIMLLPVVEQSVIGKPSLDWMRFAFLAMMVSVLVVNYLFTTFRWSAILLGLGCGLNLYTLVNPETSAYLFSPSLICVAIVPWAGRFSWCFTRKPRSDLEWEWKEFRDRFGLFWGQRMLQQFNQTAANQGWSTRMGWNGRLDTNDEKVETLKEKEMTGVIGSMKRRFRT